MSRWATPVVGPDTSSRHQRRNRRQPTIQRDRRLSCWTAGSQQRLDTPAVSWKRALDSISEIRGDTLLRAGPAVRGVGRSLAARSVAVGCGVC